MPQTIRFHLDENCSKAIAEGLRRRGVDITTTPQVGLIGVTDDEQIAFALASARVFFTQDSDFRRMAASGVPHAGIVYSPNGLKSVGEIIDRLVLIWEILEPDDLSHHVEFLRGS